MKMKAILTLLTIALALTLFACAPEEPVTDTVLTTEPLATATDAATPTDLQAMIWIDDPTLGSQIGTDGSIPLGSTDNDFVAGDPVYLAMEVGDAPATANVRVVWYGPGDQMLHEETKPVGGQGTYMNFQAPSTTGWPVGDYRVVIFANGQQAHQEDFNIEAAGNIG